MGTTRHINRTTLLLISLVLLGAGCARQVTVNSNTSSNANPNQVAQPQQTPQVNNETASWETYQSYDYDFSLRYPPVWKVSDHLSRINHCCVLFESNNYQGETPPDGTLSIQVEGSEKDSNLHSQNDYQAKAVRYGNGQVSAQGFQNAILIAKTEFPAIRYQEGAIERYVIPRNQGFSDIVLASVYVWHGKLSPEQIKLAESILATFSFGSVEQAATNEQPVDLAKDVVRKFLAAQQQGDYEGGAHALLTTEFATSTFDVGKFFGTRIGPNNRHPGKFEITNAQALPDGQTFEITAKVWDEFTAQGVSVPLEYGTNTYTVVKELKYYLISDIHYAQQPEIHQELPVTIFHPQVTEITPSVDSDDPSLSYQQSVEVASPYEYHGDTPSNLVDRIAKKDPEINNRPGDRTQLFDVVLVSKLGPYVFYFMTPTGQYCATQGGLDSPDCANSKLKAYNQTDGSVVTIAGPDFIYNGVAQVNYLPTDKKVVVLSNSQYLIFDLASNTIVRQSSKPVSADIQLEYLVTYDPASANLAFENLTNHQQLTCPISDSFVKKVLGSGSLSDKVTISPNGQYSLVLLGGKAFAWSQMSWGTGTCDAIHQVTTAVPISLGKWYRSGTMYGSMGYGSPAFIYDLSAQKEYSFPWDGGLSVGFSNNDGYWGTVGLGYKNFMLGATPQLAQNQLEVGLTWMNNNNLPGGFVIKHYTDAKLTIQPSSDIWVRAYQDKNQENLFHLLVLRHYNFKQLIDLVIQ